MRIITFSNQKGGCAKTTTVLNVGAGLARMGKKVLLVDIDPQANLTEGLGINPDGLEVTTYNLIMQSVPIADVIVKVQENLWLLPANIELAGAEVELTSLAGKDLRLKKALEQATDFDYCLIDSPPSLGQLTLNGLTACHEVMVPLQTEFFSFKALKRLLETIEMVRQYTNPGIVLSGVICTFFREQRTLNKTIVENLRVKFGERVMNTMIRDNIKLAESPAVGQDIFAYMPNSIGAEDYAALCREIACMKEGANHE